MCVYFIMRMLYVCVYKGLVCRYVAVLLVAVVVAAVVWKRLASPVVVNF